MPGIAKIFGGCPLFQRAQGGMSDNGTYRASSFNSQGSRGLILSAGADRGPEQVGSCTGESRQQCGSKVHSLAYNILRLIGQKTGLGPDVPPTTFRHAVSTDRYLDGLRSTSRKFHDSNCR